MNLTTDGSYVCTPAELKTLLEETCADLLDDIGYYLGDEELPIIPAMIARTMQCWRANALHMSPTPEDA